MAALGRCNGIRGVNFDRRGIIISCSFEIAHRAMYIANIDLVIVFSGVEVDRVLEMLLGLREVFGFVEQIGKAEGVVAVRLVRRQL